MIAYYVPLFSMLGLLLHTHSQDSLQTEGVPNCDLWAIAIKSPNILRALKSALLNNILYDSYATEVEKRIFKI